jgi:hypothetical protein
LLNVKLVVHHVTGRLAMVKHVSDAGDSSGSGE